MKGIGRSGHDRCLRPSQAEEAVGISGGEISHEPAGIPRKNSFRLSWVVLLTVAWLSWTAGAAADSPAPRDTSPTDKPTRDQKVLLDLSNKETFVLLSVNADPQNVLITDVEVSDLPIDHRLHPASGTARFGHPLDIQFRELDNVRIRLSLVRRGKELALRVSPQIVLGPSNTIDLTQDRITRTARNLRRRIKDLNQQLVGMARQRQAMHVWLISPGNKPLESVKTVRMRMKLLDQAIKARQQDVPVAQRRCAALAEAAKFVKKLHKTVEIRYRIAISRDTSAWKVEYRTLNGER